MGTVEGLTAAIFYTVHHIIVQSALFLAIGLVEQRNGTTSIRKLGGLAVLAPGLSMLFFIPALNLAGIPPFSGFIGKAALFQAGFETRDWLIFVLVAAGALTSLLTLYVIGKTWNLAFWRDPDDAEEPTEDLVEEFEERKAALADGQRRQGTQTMPRTMIVSATLMVAVSVLVTVFAGTIWDISARAAENLRSPSTYVSSVLGEEAGS